MKKILIIFSIIFSAIFAFSNPTPVYANDACSLMQGNAGKSSICAQDKVDLKNTVKNVINILLWFGGVASVLVILYASFLYVTAGGDSGKVSQAKSAIKYAVIGLIVSLLSFAIVNFVVGLL